MEKSEFKTKLPQAGSSQAVNPALGSYPEKDRVAESGRKDSGGDQSHLGRKASKMPQIVLTPSRLDVKTKSRRFSTASVAELRSPRSSISEVSSVDSAATTKHYNTWKQHSIQELSYLKKVMEEALKSCKEEVEKMEKACLIQKNVSKDIKIGIRVLEGQLEKLESHLEGYDEMLRGYSDAFFEQILGSERKE